MKISAEERLAQELYDEGFRMISGKVFAKDARGNLKWIPYDDFKKHVFKDYNGISYNARCNALKFFAACYNEPDLWPPPLIWKKAYLSNVDESKIPFHFEDKLYKLINLLLTKNGYEKFFIIWGRAQTGKSTVLNLIRQIFENDTCSIDLKQLCERFTPSYACQYRLIAASEIEPAVINSTVIKSIVSRERGTVERKGEQAIDVIWQSKLCFACNDMPTFNVLDSGMMRRLVVYQMDNQFASLDQSIRDHRYSEEELLAIIHKALYIDMTNWEKDFEFDTFTALYHQNSVYRFITEYPTDKTDYLTYRMFCGDKGLKPYNEYNYELVKTQVIDKLIKFYA